MAAELIIAYTVEAIEPYPHDQVASKPSPLILQQRNRSILSNSKTHYLRASCAVRPGLEAHTYNARKHMALCTQLN
jgi:hypothetical protein